MLRLERACGRNPGDPVTDGTGRYTREKRCPRRTNSARVHKTTSPPNRGSLSAAPHAAVGLDGREGPRRARAAAAPEGRPAWASGVQ